MKVCGITSEADLELAEEAGADFAGFVVDPGSRRYVPFGRALELGSRCLSARPVLVARALDASTAPRNFVRQAASHGARAEGAAHWVVVGTPGPVPAWASAALFDHLAESGLGGTGVKADEAAAAGFVLGCPVPVLLAGGLGPGNVAEAIARVLPAGVDACTGTESSPGVKDPARLRDFVAEAKAAFAALGRG